MIENFRKTRIVDLAILGIVVLLSSSLSFAGVGNESPKFSEKRINLTIFGGYAYSERIGGMTDLNLEIQLSLSSHVKVGLGIGYLSGNDDMHLNGNFGNMQGGMMGNMRGGIMGGFSGHNHDLKTIPITLSLLYVLPINSKLDVFMMGGGGYYFGSYKDQSTQNKSSFGPHIGLGLDLKVSDRVVIVAGGLYRFVSLKSFMSELHEGFRQGMEGEHEEGFWHFHHHDNDWHFHEEHENEQQMLMDVSTFNISLNGISLRIGIKFLF